MTIELSKNVINAIANEVVKKMQQPCEDTISRQAVLDCLTERDKIKNLPPVTPKPKTGHWIKHEPGGIGYIECSECLCWFLESGLLRNSYCPNCGAKNRK